MKDRKSMTIRTPASLQAATALAAIGSAAFAILDITGSTSHRWPILAALVASAYAAAASIYFSRLRERRLRHGRIFLIYNSRDRDVARKLSAMLKEKGYRPWLDVEEIVPGQHWLPSIIKALSESSAAVVLVSENSNATESSFFRRELEMAKEMMRSRDELSSPVIPVRLDDSPVPSDLAGVHWLDMRQQDAIDDLDRGLKRVLGAK